MPRVENIFAGLWVDACIEMMLLVGYGIESKLEVSTPTQSSTYDSAAVFLRTSVERDHHFGRIKMSVSGAVGVADSLDAARQRL